MKKKFYMVFVMLSTSMLMLFAAGGNTIAFSGIDKIMNTAIAFFSSGYVKGAASLAVGFSLFGMYHNRQNGQVIAKILPIFIVSGILLSLGVVADLMFPADSLNADVFTYTPKFGK